MSEPKVKNGNVAVVGFDIGDGSEELAKKSRKLKGQNLSKLQKLAKSGKSLLKSGNLSNFGTIEAGPSFLTLGARDAFNYL